MSGNKNKGFSQTSKQYDGSLKAQHQQSRNKQSYHPAMENRNLEETNKNKSANPTSFGSKK